MHIMLMRLLPQQAACGEEEHDAYGATDTDDNPWEEPNVITWSFHKYTYYLLYTCSSFLFLLPGFMLPISQTMSLQIHQNCHVLYVLVKLLLGRPMAQSISEFDHGFRCHHVTQIVKWVACNIKFTSTESFYLENVC